MFGLTRFIGRWITRLLLLILLTGVVCYFLKDRLVKHYIDVQLAKVTGLTIKADKVNTDILRRTLVISDIELSHPLIMENVFLAKLSNVKITVSLWKFLFKKLSFERLEVNIETFQTVEDSSGLSTETYMRKLAKNITMEMGSWEYTGVENFYLRVGRHQRVDLETPDKIKSWRDLNVETSAKSIATPGELITILNTILYPQSARLKPPLKEDYKNQSSLLSASCSSSETGSEGSKTAS